MMMFPYVEPVQGSATPRYRLRTGMRYWSGQEWTHDKEKAALYASQSQAGRDLYDILLREHAQDPCCQSFVVPILVQTRSQQPLKPQDVMFFLEQAMSFTMNFRQRGVGPDQTSVVLPTIEWSQLRETEPCAADST